MFPVTCFKTPGEISFKLQSQMFLGVLYKYSRHMFKILGENSKNGGTISKRSLTCFYDVTKNGTNIFYDTERVYLI